MSILLSRPPRLGLGLSVAGIDEIGRRRLHIWVAAECEGFIFRRTRLIGGYLRTSQA